MTRGVWVASAATLFLAAGAVIGVRPSLVLGPRSLNRSIAATGAAVDYALDRAEENRETALKQKMDHAHDEAERAKLEAMLGFIRRRASQRKKAPVEWDTCEDDADCELRSRSCEDDDYRAVNRDSPPDTNCKPCPPRTPSLVSYAAFCVAGHCQARIVDDGGPL